MTPSYPNPQVSKYPRMGTTHKIGFFGGHFVHLNDDDSLDIKSLMVEFVEKAKEYLRKEHPNMLLIEIHKIKTIDVLKNTFQKYWENKRVIFICCPVLGNEDVRFDGHHFRNINVEWNYQGKILKSAWPFFNKYSLNDFITDENSHECNICFTDLSGSGRFHIYCEHCHYSACSRCLKKNKMKCFVCKKPVKGK